jgi:hypothetical protein
LLLDYLRSKLGNFVVQGGEIKALVILLRKKGNPLEEALKILNF